jgi:hypothetical protein
MNRSLTPFVTALGLMLSMAPSIPMATATGAHAADPPQLSLPLDCPDTGCIIQSYVDIDPGPQWQDHACGNASYDGHTGTDFRLTDLRDMASGVAVRAAAGGIVTATRDGMEDRYFERDDAESMRGRGCGNGIVLDHGGGWTTQYCHLRKGSISVRKGQRLETGDAIGLVGLSGRTEFPHLELIVRQGTRVVDPFAIVSGGSETAHPDCTMTAPDLWTDPAEASLTYADGRIINSGFADAVPSLREIDNRARTVLSLSPQTSALVAYGRAINLRQGDVLRVTLKDGRGQIRASGDSGPMAGPRAQQMYAAGIRRAQQGWSEGAYTGVIEVVRNGTAHARTEIRIDQP